MLGFVVEMEKELCLAGQQDLPVGISAYLTKSLTDFVLVLLL